ncbi:MAG TPA: hypothetical protein VLH77_06055 [Gammaproteobacteria bacterium]|nr:hypothetical protein [Gammaproteobacteria bacterium]
MTATTQDSGTTTQENELVQALAKAEHEFREQVDHLYKITTIALTTGTAITVFFFPPAAFVGAGLDLILALIHHYDKKHGYKLSHGLVNFANKIRQGKAAELSGDEISISVSPHSSDRPASSKTLAFTQPASSKTLTLVQPEPLKMKKKVLGLHKHSFFSHKKKLKAPLAALPADNLTESAQLKAVR